MKRSGTYTIVLGIAGTDRHVGVTHLSIMLANYLTSKEKCRVAVVDRSTSNSLAVLQKIYEDETDQTTHGQLGGQACFQVHKVTYYCQMKQKDIANIFHMGYEYVVIDFGKVCLQQCDSEIWRCHMRILVGSCCEWQQQAFIQALEDKISVYDAGKWNYAAFLGIQAIRHKLEKQYHIKIKTIPFEKDPFQLHRTHFELLKNMLQEE